MTAHWEGEFFSTPSASTSQNSHDDSDEDIREFKQPRRRRQQKPHKFAYLYR